MLAVQEGVKREALPETYVSWYLKTGGWKRASKRREVNFKPQDSDPMSIGAMIQISGEVLPFHDWQVNFSSPPLPERLG